MDQIASETVIKNYLSFRICEIPSGIFEDLTTLEWVKLNNNELTTLRYELIEPILSTLKHIDVYSKFHINSKHDISVYPRKYNSFFEIIFVIKFQRIP